MAKTEYCEVCGRVLTSEEIDSGLVVRGEEGYVCAECLPRMEVERAQDRAHAPVEAEAAPEHETEYYAEDEVPERNSSDSESEDDDVAGCEQEQEGADGEQMLLDMVASLREIRQDVRALSRTALYDRASVWNVFGGVLQVLVFGIIAFSLVRAEPDGHDLFLLALLAQVMALTFFVKGK